MKVAVFIVDATTAEEANAICKTKPAYRQILFDYPSDKWNRKHSQTYPLSLDQANAAGWYVEFEVVEKSQPGETKL